ncbi:MAG: ATP-binding protein [Planctomycetes bacterium]|nr:ATP-binding protein [Planctomycetota bacterium]
MNVLIEPGPAPIPGETILRVRIPASQCAKSALVERAMALIEDHVGLDEMDRFRVRLCFDEALQNALDHGSGGDPSKGITLVIFETPDRWGATVSDEGDGFSEGEIPDPLAPGALLREDGRGILIMRQYMDEVSYYDGGRTVLLARAKRAAVGGGADGSRGSTRVG